MKEQTRNMETGKWMLPSHARGKAFAGKEPDRKGRNREGFDKKESDGNRYIGGSRHAMKMALSLILSLCMVIGLLPIQHLLPEQMKEQAGIADTVQAAEYTLSDPRIEADSSMTSGQKVTWDCIWFGSYPQAEVIPSGNYTAIRSVYLQTGDTIVDDSLYSALQNASGWDSNGDIMLNGKKYRRMKKGDATYSTSGHFYAYYNWSDSTTYHYFKYEPIKWRVLDVDGDKALILADKALDDRQYNMVDESVTWEKSTIRSFLNGYGASANQRGVDFSTSQNFLTTAFGSNQRSALFDSNVIQSDSLYNTSASARGNDTVDKVFLLSDSEVYGTDKAQSYGFVYSDDTYDEARRSRSSTYARAMGTAWYTYSGNKWNCGWLLRSPGYDSNSAIGVSDDGEVNDGYCRVDYDYVGIRPASFLNLKYTNLYSYAGTVCSDGTGKESGKDTAPGDNDNPQGTTGNVASFSLNANGGSGAANGTIQVTGSLKLSDSVQASKSAFDSEVNAIQWTSSNENVAKVTGCRYVTSAQGGREVSLLVSVASYSEGEAVITGRTANGLTSSCTVIVKKQEEVSEDEGEGHIFSEGKVTLSYRSDGKLGNEKKSKSHNVTHDFYYSDKFFYQNNTEYNNSLAVMTLGLELTAFSDPDVDDKYTVTMPGNERANNIKKAYKSLGFSKIEYQKYDVPLSDASNTVAYSFAKKTITSGSSKDTLVAVVVRGGGYGAEWASNFDVGKSGNANGFDKAALDVSFDALYQR